MNALLIVFVSIMFFFVSPDVFKYTIQRTYLISITEPMMHVGTEVQPLWGPGWVAWRLCASDGVMLSRANIRIVMRTATLVSKVIMRDHKW